MTCSQCEVYFKHSLRSFSIEICRNKEQVSSPLTSVNRCLSFFFRDHTDSNLTSSEIAWRCLCFTMQRSCLLLWIHQRSVCEMRRLSFGKFTTAFFTKEPYLSESTDSFFSVLSTWKFLSPQKTITSIFLLPIALCRTTRISYLVSLSLISHSLHVSLCVRQKNPHN